MDPYAFIGRYIVRPTLVILKSHLFCLELVSDSPPQTTNIYRQNGVSEQTKKVT